MRPWYQSVLDQLDAHPLVAEVNQVAVEQATRLVQLLAVDRSAAAGQVDHCGAAFHHHDAQVLARDRRVVEADVAGQTAPDQGFAVGQEEALPLVDEAEAGHQPPW